MLHRRDGARFPPDVSLGIHAEEFNLGFIFGKLKAGLLLRSGFRLIGGVLQRWLSFWKVLPSPQRNSRTLSE